MKDEPVVVPCPGVEGYITGKGGVHVNDLRERFKCRCYDLHFDM